MYLLNQTYVSLIIIILYQFTKLFTKCYNTTIENLHIIWCMVLSTSTVCVFDYITGLYNQNINTNATQHIETQESNTSRLSIYLYTSYKTIHTTNKNINLCCIIYEVNLKPPTKLYIKC